MRDPCVGRAGWLGRAQGGGWRARRTSRRSRSACPGIEEREDEGDVGPSSDGPQQKLEPADSGSQQAARPVHAPVPSRVSAL